MTHKPTLKGKEKIKIASVNCFRCDFRMQASDKTDLYDQIVRMQGCPNGCQRPSLQILIKSI